ncbi:hypothetical protein O181_001542 [Austropuccinia psidii MF-1]|uniref:Uncharacterized protein n=1 Tax=Austropuccinia psidii MF-1 TaxID=1389203 RepID=A0A9Q3BAT1_9BASI|nr:hypothetical protein [Austropuccinia psidii MF-1]
MTVQHSSPEREARSKAKAQASLTTTPRKPLGGTPAVPQLRAHLGRAKIIEGEAPYSKKGRGPRREISLSGDVDTFPGISNTSFKGVGEDGEEE